MVVHCAVISLVFQGMVLASLCLTKSKQLKDALDGKPTSVRPVIMTFALVIS